MAETKEMITEEDIQRQQSLVSQLKSEVGAMETHVSDAKNRVDSLTAQIEALSNASTSIPEPVEADLDVKFDETITIMPKIYEELRKKYQMIENDPQVQVLRDEVRKAELDTVYGPNPDFDKKSAELEKLLADNKNTLDDLKKQMASCEPTVISQLDRILNRYQDAELNPEDMYYSEFERDQSFLEDLAKKYFPDEEIKTVFEVTRKAELDRLDNERKDLIGKMVAATQASPLYQTYQTQLAEVRKNISALRQVKNISISDVRNTKIRLEEEVKKAKEEVRKAELDTVYGPNPDLEKRTKDLEALENNLRIVNNYIQRSTRINPIDHMISEYHKLRTRVERARDDADDMYPEFSKEEALLHEIEEAAFIHFNHFNKPIVTPSISAPSNSEEIANLKAQLQEANDDYNQLVQQANVAKTKYDDAVSQLDEMKEQHQKQGEPKPNPFANTGDATIKATRWECTLQQPAKKGLVKIAMSTETGRKIYERLREKREQKYANKLNDLQERVDVANANYSRISGNYDSLQNKYDAVENLIDGSSTIAKLTQKISNEINQRNLKLSERTRIYHEALQLLNIPESERQNITEKDVLNMLNQRADEASISLAKSLVAHAKLTNTAAVAIKKDQTRLTNLKAERAAKLEQAGFDPATVTDADLAEKLDELSESLEYFDYDELNKLEKKQAKAEEKLDRFKKRLERLGATITPVEVKLDPENLSKRKVRSMHPTNRFAVFFRDLKDKLTRNDDDDDYINDEEEQVENEELASEAFKHSSVLDSNGYDNSSAHSENSEDANSDEKEDFSIPISQSNPDDATQTTNSQEEMQKIGDPVLPINPAQIFAHAPKQLQNEEQQEEVDQIQDSVDGDSFLGDINKVDEAKDFYNTAPTDVSIPATTSLDVTKADREYWETLKEVSNFDGSSNDLVDDSSKESGRHR